MAQFVTEEQNDKKDTASIEKDIALEKILWEIRRLIGMCVKEAVLSGISSSDDTLMVLAKVKPIIKQQDVIEEKIKNIINKLTERIITEQK